MVVHPLRQCRFGRGHVAVGGHGQFQAVVQAQDVKRATRTKGGVHERAGQRDDLFGQQGGRQFAREFVQAARVGLALDRRLRLQAQAGGKLADQQAHAKQHAEGQQVLHVRHGERRQGLHEEEVEQPDADDGRERGWPASVPQCDGGHGQQEQHDDVGLVQRGEDE